ncbi:MAG: CAP domain-containing protein [Actinomycetota bacterium]|nr:CAP domain-containing protein [Actinomycetota bacterium]
MRLIRTLVTACLLAALALPASAQAASAPEIMLRKVNAVRAQHGLAGLRASPSLNASAAGYSHWLMATDNFGHLASIGASRSFDRLGEVLAIHGGRKGRITRTVRRWMGSPGHRAVILDSSFRYFGAGRTVGRFRGRRATIWVGQFGMR